MNHGGVRLALPSRSCGFVGGGYNTTFDDMVEAADVRCARSMDALIDGLLLRERLAVHHAYLAAVWHGRGLQDALVQAKEKLAKGMAAKGMY